MALYESVFIARQEISSSQAEQLADQFAEIVTSNGGDVKGREHWGLRNLAYRIKKNRKGHYVMFHLDSPPAAVQEMERNMRIHEDVLRYLTIRLDTLPEGPSPIMKARAERGERSGRRDRDRARAARAAEARAAEAKARSAEQPAPAADGPSQEATT